MLKTELDTSYPREIKVVMDKGKVLLFIDGIEQKNLIRATIRMGIDQVTTIEREEYFG